MQKNLLSGLAATLGFVATLWIGACFGQSSQPSGKAPSSGADQMGHTTSPKSLPEVFSIVLPKIRAQTHVPILLPSHLPDPIAKAKYAVVDEAGPNGYTIELYYQKLGGGYVQDAGMFAAERRSRYGPDDLLNTRAVGLASRIQGFFRTVSCGGSCAPADLSWIHDGVLYEISIELSPSISDERQQKVIVAVADSAIRAGPR